MTTKRITALLLSLLLLLGALPSALADSPHTHAWKEKSRVNPTCTKDGYAVYVCSCGARKTEPLPALGHKFSKKVYVSYADCEHYGVFYWICERCGAHSENGNDKPLGHDWDEGKVTKAPTATEDGEMTYTCKRDPSHTKTEVIPATGEDDGPHPALTLSASAGEVTLHEYGPSNDGSGYDIDLHTMETVTNAGNIPLQLSRHVWYNKDVSEESDYYEYKDSLQADGTRTGADTCLLYSYSAPLDDPYNGSIINHLISTPSDPQYRGYCDVSICYYGYDIDDTDREGEILCKSNVVTLRVYVPNEFEEAKPELTIKWEYDEIWPNGDWHVLTKTAKPGVLAPEDSAFARCTNTNSGNVPLKVISYVTFDNGEHYSRFVGSFTPGESRSDVWGSDPVAKRMTPGTETEDLLGTLTVSFYCVGYAPETYVNFADTGPELCRTETITRTWKIGKNAEPEDPGDSKLSGKLDVRPGYESSDPAGYQLGEEVSTVLTVINSGIVGIESFTVSDPFDGAAFSDGPIAVSGTKSYIRANVTVTDKEVEAGHIEFPMITIKWTDPDTKKERTAFAGPLTVPVLKKTGLLLKKGYEDPKNGEYFTEGEQIAWTLSVMNNSKEPITDIKVDDQGVTVGEYAELKPNDKENCTVPTHTVTEYEAKVVGYVLNYATAIGTDYLGAIKTWPSNVAKAITKKPLAPGEDPKGEIHGLHPAISIVKAEDPAGPNNGSYYEANEPIKYTITVKNTGDTELKDIAVTDSLAGFAPIGTLASLAPNEEKTFDYSYMVKEEDIPYQWIYNSATVTYTFGDNIKGTPRTSNTVQSRVGNEPFPPELPHLDPDKLPEGDDYCTLMLNFLGETEARYTLHACAEHAEAAMAAEEAAANGDWKAAAEIWEKEVEELYEILYYAADSQLKGTLITERAVFYDYLDSFDPLTVDETVKSMKANVDSLYDLLLATADEAKTAELLAEKEKLYADIDASYGGSEGKARANTLRLKCAFLCCAMHTVPNELPSSLAGDYAQMMDGMEVTETARIFGTLEDTDSEVTETYASAALKAHNDVIDLLSSARSYDADKVFARGQQLWQVALDNEVNPIYEAADKEQRILIATWRISLDTLYAAEKDFLALLYEGNNETQQEQLMELYKDAVLFTGSIR
ncbi:MAG: hypothetical protein IKY06_06590 [Clostridia bacterium]|nr:hypothetical protein [Clostridia bacterium]